MTCDNDIAITLPIPDILPDDVPDTALNAIFRDLRILKRVSGPNKNDEADVLISALIDRGINTGPRIIGAAKRLDLDGRHAGIRLREGIGHRWSRDKDGTYRNLM